MEPTSLGCNPADKLMPFVCSCCWISCYYIYIIHCRLVIYRNKQQTNKNRSPIVSVLYFLLCVPRLVVIIVVQTLYVFGILLCKVKRYVRWRNFLCETPLWWVRWCAHCLSLSSLPKEFRVFIYGAYPLDTRSRSSWILYVSSDDVWRFAFSRSQILFRGIYTQSSSPFCKNSNDVQQENARRFGLRRSSASASMSHL